MEGLDMIMSLGIIKIAVEFKTKKFLNAVCKFFTIKTNTCNEHFFKQQSELICFLGLKDKNGNIIHFGDILVDNRNNLLTPVCEIENGEHVFFFKPLQHLDKKISIGCKSTYSNTLEIIGNIYKNTKTSVKFPKHELYINKSMEYCFIENPNTSYLH